jgi:hypothetical protein
MCKYQRTIYILFAVTFLVGQVLAEVEKNDPEVNKGLEMMFVSAIASQKDSAPLKNDLSSSKASPVESVKIPSLDVPAKIQFYENLTRRNGEISSFTRSKVEVADDEGETNFEKKTLAKSSGMDKPLNLGYSFGIKANEGENSENTIIENHLKYPETKDNEQIRTNSINNQNSKIHAPPSTNQSLQNNNFEYNESLGKQNILSTRRSSEREHLNSPPARSVNFEVGENFKPNASALPNTTNTTTFDQNEEWTCKCKGK